jgi:HSP20 family molecular chaperone IbpA
MKEPEISVNGLDGRKIFGKKLIEEKIKIADETSLDCESLVAQILNKKNLTLYVELPGIEKEKIKVFLTEDPELMIEIEAQSSNKKIPAFKTKVRPKKKANIDPNGQFTTSFTNGVLEIVFPLKEAAKKKEIPIL